MKILLGAVLGILGLFIWVNFLGGAEAYGTGGTAYQDTEPTCIPTYCSGGRSFNYTMCWCE